MLPFELHLACRNLSRHPWHMAGMVLGLAVAVLVMVYIPSTMSSFYDDLIDRAIEQNAAHVTVWPKEKPRGQLDKTLRREAGDGIVLALDDRTYPRYRDLNGQHALAMRLAQAPGVQAVASFVRGSATVSRGRVNLGVTVEGIDPREYAHVVNIARHFPDGRAPKLGPSDIAIGFRMAQKLAIHVDEHIHVATAQTSRVMRVKAIFRSGYYDKDMQHAYVALSTGQRMFAMGSEVSALALRCEELNEAAHVTAALNQRLDHKIRNWMDDNASLLAEIATVQRVTLFINILVALVASAGMANVFSMFILNRQKELAILRAMGSSRSSLKTILMTEAAVIWLIGTVIGCTIALGVMAFEQSNPYTVSEETYGIGSYATSPKLSAFVLAGVLSACTMGLSAWWSGRKAAKLDPVRVIFGR